MRINFLLPSLKTTGGLRVVFEIANRLHGSHDVRLYSPLIPYDIRFRPSSLPARIRDLIRESSERIQRGKKVGWMDVKPPIDLCTSYDRLTRPILRRRVRSADVTIATSTGTAYAAADLPSKTGKGYYFVQHYEIWPVWADSECWEMASQLEGRPSVAMADVEPQDSYLRRYKQRVDQSYHLPLDLIVTSKWEQTVMERLGEMPIGKVPYGIDHSLFYPEDGSVSQEGTTTILALYRGSTEKGDREAIAAFKQLKRRYPELDFIMFGLEKGDEIPAFVEFHPDPPQSKLRTLYSRADILVYPSWVEGYGIPPMEAMACRTAIVSTDVGAVRDYSPKGVVNFVPIRDVKAIVEAVEFLHENPEIRYRKKQRGYEHIQRFDWDISTEKFQSLISDS